MDTVLWSNVILTGYRVIMGHMDTLLVVIQTSY